LTEKARPGNHGSNKGVRTAPATTATRIATAEKKPWLKAFVQPSPDLPSKDKRKKTGIMIRLAFRAPTSSIGISSARSLVVKV
jgi:hypothetical protein